MPPTVARLLVITIAYAAIVAFQIESGPARAEWGHVIRLLLAAPVLAAAFWFGPAVGLATGTASATLTILAHASYTAFDPGPLVVEALLYPSAGLVAGWLVARERQRYLAARGTVERLTVAHSALKDSFEGLKRAERLFSLGQLSAGLAHEIRNPLASIAGAVRLLRRSAQSGQQQFECLDIIESESQRLNRLLTNFLDFARPRPPQFRPVDVNSVFDTVMTLAVHGLGRDDVELRKEVQPSLPLPECDAEQLQQVLLNLTINAIEASSEPGEVVLSASREGDNEVLLRVRDEGIGVSRENVDRLFDPFFTTKENGTGLGLPVAHEIVRMFGGTLSAERNPDRGMTFSILLPVHRKGIHETEAHSAG